MPGLTKCQPFLIVLGVRRKGIGIALLEVARSLQLVAADLKSPEEKEEEEARVEKLPFLCWQEEEAEGVTGGACCMEGKGGVLGEAGSVVKMGKTRRSQVELGEMSPKDTAEAAISPTAPGQRGRQRAATSRETAGLRLGSLKSNTRVLVFLALMLQLPRATGCPRLGPILMPQNKLPKLFFGWYLWRKVMVLMVKCTNFKPSIPSRSVTFTFA